VKRPHYGGYYATAQPEDAHAHTLSRNPSGSRDLRSLPVAMVLVLLYYYYSKKKARETEKRYGGKSTGKMFIYIMGEEVILNEIFIYIMGEEVTLNQMSIYIFFFFLLL
jgi:hypothetical protein